MGYNQNNYGGSSLQQEVSALSFTEDRLSSMHQRTSSWLPTKLNLGCGNDYRQGWLNIDISPEVNPDMHFDAFSFPWKDLLDGHFELVLVNHLVEHIPHAVKGSSGEGFFVFFEEIYRILKDYGAVLLKVPHWKHPNTFIDPTHTRVLHRKTFEFFDPSHPSHYGTQAKFRVTRAKENREDRLSRGIKQVFGWRVPGIRKVELEVAMIKLP